MNLKLSRQTHSEFGVYHTMYINATNFQSLSVGQAVVWHRQFSRRYGAFSRIKATVARDARNKVTITVRHDDGAGGVVVKNHSVGRHTLFVEQAKEVTL